MKMLHKYVNGNYTVSLYSDGTKIRETEDEFFKAEFPESIDIKLTNWCNMGQICKYCHEASNTKGKHADLSVLIKTLKTLPKGVELALGGGSTLHHPDIVTLLQMLHCMGLVVNVTINELHISHHRFQILQFVEDSLIQGLGLSFRSAQKDHRALFSVGEYPNTVLHVIAGLDPLERVLDILSQMKHKKLLILGYKQFRKGVEYFNTTPSVSKELKVWYNQFPVFLQKCLDTGAVVSFDNLAIEQLKIQRVLSEDDWNTFYQGDDGSHTFYMDAVEQQYALSSTSSDRYPFLDCATEMFKSLKPEEKEQQ